MRIAALCGSLGSTSSHARALAVATNHLVGQGVDVETVRRLEDVPAFGPDAANDPPDAVARLARQFELADAAMIAGPEYAGGLAGVVKNALDWLVGSASLYRKPVAVLSVGTTGGAHAIEGLVRTLSYHGALVVATLGIAAPRTKTDASGTMTDRATIAEITAWTDQLVAALKASTAELLTQVSQVVKPYGIDPSRFGDLS